MPELAAGKFNSGLYTDFHELREEATFKGSPQQRGNT
jgi:hypothetical protein